LTSKKPQSSLEKNNEQQGEKRTVLTCSDGKKITLNASAEAFGSENIEFSDGLIRQIVSIGSHSWPIGHGQDAHCFGTWIGRLSKRAKGTLHDSRCIGT
jgi:hypothetical protein